MGDNRSEIPGGHAGVETSTRIEPSGEGSDVIGFTSPPETVRLLNESPVPGDEEILARAREIGEMVLGPRAQETDQGPGPNRANFDVLGRAGLLALAVPRQYGGLDVSGGVQRDYTELLASYCGVTTFTQAQHHGPCRMIANGPNPALKERLLPDLSAGRMMCAVSFAHLRRPGPPVLQATPVDGGYCLNGTAPWVTGWGLMNQVVFGATLPDGRFIYLWSPGRREDFPELFDGGLPQEGCRGSLTASAPLPLCAMNASATVTLTCQDWFIPEEHRLSESDRETMRRNDRNGVLGATAMPLGCATASVRLIRETAERRGIPAADRAAGSFDTEVQDARNAVREWSARTGDQEFFPQALKIRAWCIDLAVRAAHAAVAASSGSANSLSHPAQRLYREAMFYTVQAQTHEVMDATLARLER